MEWQRVYVLHQRHFSDARYWVDLITQEQGRVSVLWRKTKKIPPLIPFTSYQASWATRGQQKLLTACEAQGGPIKLEGDALFCGFYVNELCERLLLLDDASQSPFYAYENALKELAEGDSLELPLRNFEWQIICHLGFEFSFTHEGFNGTALVSERWYRFNPRVGFEPAVHPAPDVFRGGDLLAIAAGARDGNLARTLKLIFRRALQHKLGAKPLKSREYFI